jgi:DNA polymerase
VVFGSGYAQASLMFIGEGPGREEDEQGLPFVGRAGRLLEQMILSLGFNRDSVYITNIVKCRPPQNREPSEQESSACRTYLHEQIKLIAPKLILAIGATALKNLVPDAPNITKARQNMFEFQNIKLIALYHPAYLLRNRTKLNQAWQDLIFVRSYLEDAF